MSSTEDHLRAALAAVEREMAQLQERRGQILAILGPSAETRPADGPQRSADQAQASGFRDAIRAVLKSADHGLLPREVKAALEGQGIQASGKVPLASRVHNELWRMSERGLVRKVGRKYYPPKE